MQWFTQFAGLVARWAGHPVTFVLALLSVIFWVLTGPLFDYSDHWQMIINTGTTIATFLMVFLIQATQNRDGAAVQGKLDALIKASQASDQVMSLDALTEAEIRAIRQQLQHDD
jgi:low affinity Fe/Cu permease